MVANATWVHRLTMWLGKLETKAAVLTVAAGGGGVDEPVSSQL